MTSKVHLLFTLIASLTVGGIAFYGGRFWGDSVEIKQAKGAFDLSQSAADLSELQSSIVMAERLVEPSEEDLADLRLFLSMRLERIVEEFESTSPTEQNLITPAQIERAKSLVKELTATNPLAEEMEKGSGKPD